MSDRAKPAVPGFDGCAYCRHLLSRSTCTAYPDGIPMVIASGERSHIEPFIRDHGVVFEPYDPENPTVANPAIRRAPAGG